MTPLRRLELSVIMLEVIAFLALLSTGELKSWIGLVTLCVALVAYTRNLLLGEQARSVPDKVLLFVGVLLLFAFGFALVKLKWHPVLVSAQGVTAFLALTWFSKSGTRQFNLRFALSAVVLILSAALSPEIVIGGLAFLYFLIASVALFDFFLIRFGSQPSALTKLPSVRRWVLVLTVLTLIGSLAAFPILPRPQKKWQAQMGGAWSRIGLSGSVELNSDFKARSQDKSIAFRVIVPESIANRAFVESKIDLWRGKTLDVLAESGWYASSSSQVQDQLVSESNLFDTSLRNRLELIREPTSLNIVSVPYGTTEIFSSNSAQAILKNESTGDFRLSRSFPDYLKFGFVLEKVKSPRARPSATLIKVPTGLSFKNPKWTEWLKAGQNLKSPEDKVQLVQKLFAVQGLEWSIAGSASDKGASLSPIETFLFESRKGHCEFFATAAALLLRSWSVPTRLVTGYRSNSGFKSNLLVVYESDAHAWLEFVNSEGRWVPFDPTPAPRQIMMPLFLDYLSTLKNRLETGWYLYVLEFDSALAMQRAKAFVASNQRPLLAVAALGLVALLARWLGRKRPLRLINGQRDRRSTPRAMRKMAQWLLNLERRHLFVVEQKPHPQDFETWFKDFQKIRFGRQKFSPEQLQSLYRDWVRNRKQWQKSFK